METPVVPTASPATLPELATYLEPFAPLFRRSTSRESLERYVTGLLTDLPHKNCDTIAAAVAGTSTERLQYLLTDAVWEPQALDQQRVRALVAHSRWPIEQFYEDAKDACGLDHYQGRRWDGLHRHLALVMLAYSFLARQRWRPAMSAGVSPSGERPSFL
ncbi:MAG TPA: transposase [Candidatus Saccharimonadia bacterium]|nr:transposase [Candidatus Saccharimonadia bacterium]